MASFSQYLLLFALGHWPVYPLTAALVDLADWQLSVFFLIRGPQHIQNLTFFSNFQIFQYLLVSCTGDFQFRFVNERLYISKKNG